MNSDMTLPEIRMELTKVRGHLVPMPIDFLIVSDLGARRAPRRAPWAPSFGLRPPPNLHRDEGRRVGDGEWSDGRSMETRANVQEEKWITGGDWIAVNPITLAIYI